MSTGLKVGLGAAGVGLLGGLVYLATRPVSTQTERLAGVPGAEPPSDDDKDDDLPATPLPKKPAKVYSAIDKIQIMAKHGLKSESEWLEWVASQEES